MEVSQIKLMVGTINAKLFTPNKCSLFFLVTKMKMLAFIFKFVFNIHLKKPCY